MPAKKQIQLFLASGCLTEKTMLAYHQGRLAKEDRRSVKDHLEGCSLCREAAEGLSSIKDPGMLGREIAALNQRILVQTTEKPPVRTLHPGGRKIPVMKSWIFAAAASVVVLLGFYFLIQRMQQPEDSHQLAAVTDTTQNELDQLRQNEQVAVTDSRNVVAEESIPVRASRSVEPRFPEPEPQVIASAENTEAIADIPIASENTVPLPDSLISAPETDQVAVVEIKEMDASEPPSVIEGISVGGVAARKEKSSFRTVTINQETTQGEDIFLSADQMPVFPGGDDSLSAFLRRNLHYPQEALALGTEGTVYLTFVVEKDGAVSDVRVRRGLSEACNQEAIRVVSSMPRWIPGQQGNTPVRVQYNLTIHFQFPDKQ
ncbi:MAG: TonB family protein [Bacteroidales bacterium]|nr:TonB family protein [Bacteroidales bacterium]